MNVHENPVSNQISADGIRGFIDLLVLYLIRDEPDYGYSISKRIQLTGGNLYAIKETTLYSAFTRLERNGYVVSFDGGSENSRRTYYRISDAGRIYYEAKCREWELTKKVVDAFVTKS